MLLAFIKKLIGFHFEIKSSESSLILSYGTKYGEWTGRLELRDISKYYQGFTDIPELEVYNFLD